MINITCFINALKSSWIKRLKGTQNLWKIAYNRELHKYDGDLIFKSKLHYDDAKHILTKYKFLNEILCSWCKINFSDTCENISNEIIWHNTRIKGTDNKTIFYKDWYNKGIMYIKHIYDYRIKEFYNFNHLTYLYNLNNNDFLKYYTLIGNILAEWKTLLRTEHINNNAPEHLISKISSIKKPNKILYNKQIKSLRMATLKHTEKWENELENRELDWKIIFSLPAQCTISTKLREFQYKYLMRIIPNNSFLFK